MSKNKNQQKQQNTSSMQFLNGVIETNTTLENKDDIEKPNPNGEVLPHMSGNKLDTDFLRSMHDETITEGLDSDEMVELIAGSRLSMMDKMGF